MEVRVVDIQPGLTHVALAGKLDVAGEALIASQFKDLTEGNRRPTLVDMSEVTYLASLGIRLLFVCAKALAAQGNKMVVLNPQPMVEETLMTSGTVNLIPISRDIKEALAILGS